MCWPVFVAAVAFAATPHRSQAPKDEHLKIATLGLQAFNLEPAKLDLLSERLAAGFELGGVQVATEADVAAALGAERREKLAGCAEESQECRDELAGALDADALLTGSAGRIGEVWQVQVKVIASKDGALLAAFSRATDGEERLLAEAQSAAREVAPKLLARTGRGPDWRETRKREPRANVMSISPVALAFAGPMFSRPVPMTSMIFIGVEYERVVFPNLSLAGALQYSSYMDSDTAVEVTVMPRLYPGDSAPEGFFFALPLSVLMARRRWQSELTGVLVLPGAMIGWAWLLGGHFAISAGIGAAYLPAGYQDPLLLLGRANVGVAF